MINLEISDLEKRDNAETSILYDTAKYPYGMKLHVDPETYKKLGLAEVPDLGEKMVILAHVEVSSLSKAPGKGDEVSVDMCLQITDIDLKTQDVEEQEEQKNPASVMYGED